MIAFFRKDTTQAERFGTITRAPDRFGFDEGESFSHFVALFDAIRPRQRSDIEIAVENYRAMLTMIEKDAVHSGACTKALTGSFEIPKCRYLPDRQRGGRPSSVDLQNLCTNYQRE